MKYNKCFAFGLAALLFMAAFSVKANEKTAGKMYVFGVATSFNDSTAYFTSIQELDSAVMVGKTGLIANKQDYSYQLKNYLNGQGLSHRTCVTYNDSKLKSIEKKYAKLRQRLTKRGSYIIKDIDAGGFRYERVSAAQ